MKLSDIVGQAQVAYQIETDKKEDAIKALLGLLEEAGKVSAEDSQKVYRALLARERLGTTGIGGGVAVPHAKVDCVTKPVGALGLLNDKIDFSSVDGAPVDVVLLFLFPKDEPETHLKVMGHVSGILRSSPFCQYARGTKNKKALWELVKDAEDL